MRFMQMNSNIIKLIHISFLPQRWQRTNSNQQQCQCLFSSVTAMAPSCDFDQQNNVYFADQNRRPDIGKSGKPGIKSDCNSFVCVCVCGIEKVKYNIYFYLYMIPV